jgi:hypothetical protein
MATARSRP